MSEDHANTQREEVATGDRIRIGIAVAVVIIGALAIWWVRRDTPEKQVDRLLAGSIITWRSSDRGTEEPALIVNCSVMTTPSGRQAIVELAPYGNLDQMQMIGADTVLDRLVYTYNPDQEQRSVSAEIVPIMDKLVRGEAIPGMQIVTASDRILPKVGLSQSLFDNGHLLITAVAYASTETNGHVLPERSLGNYVTYTKYKIINTGTGVESVSPSQFNIKPPDIYDVRPIKQIRLQPGDSVEVWVGKIPFGILASIT